MGEELQTSLSGSQKFMQYVLIAINVLFLIFGCVLCAVGSYALNNKVAVLSGQTLPQGIIVVGAFMLVMSLLGAVSAWKQIRIGLGLYFILLALLSVILIAVGIAVYVKRDQADFYIRQGWFSASRDTRASLQAAFSCCGLDVFNVSGDSMQVYDAPCDSPNNAAIADRFACLPVMSMDFKSYFSTAGSCGIAFSVLMFIALAFICFLMRGIKDSAINRAIEKNRVRNEKDKEKKRKQGKGLKLPNNVL